MAPTESTASCNVVKILSHEEFIEKHPHPPSPVYVRIDRHADTPIDRQVDADINRQPPASIDRRAPITYRVQMLKIDVARLTALRPKPKSSGNPPKEKKGKIKKPQTSSRRINDPGIIAACHCGAEYETKYSASFETHTATSIDSAHKKSTDTPKEESVDSSPDDWENDCFNPIMAVYDAPPKTPDDLPEIQAQVETYSLLAEACGKGTRFSRISEAIDREIRESIDGAKKKSFDVNMPPSIDRRPEFGRRVFDLFGARKFYWEDKDENGKYRDDQGCARDMDGHIINVSKEEIINLMERASRDEQSYICLPEHASSFTQTKLLPEIYTKDEINEMFYGVCGAQEKYESDFQMKLDGVYHPLNDSIGWLITCMEEMRQDIAKIQQATDVSRHTSIDRRHHASIDSRLPTSIDQRLPASVDNNPPHSPPMKSQQDFHNREEIDQLVEEIYRALDTTENRLDGRCDDIYFPIDLTLSALTFKIKAMQGELVGIQSYIARRPETSASMDRRNNISTDIRKQTSVNDATNRGRLVPKVTSDMSDTHYHGEEISADTYITLRRHQFNLKSLGDRLQRMENTTATMTEKWRRGDEAMRDFTGLGIMGSNSSNKSGRPTTRIELEEGVAEVAMIAQQEAEIAELARRSRSRLAIKEGEESRKRTR
ncbi:hypothetical protein F2Q68_00025597 [Brassica cretica]|uniref:Uncharacterized protein n=1 Tax=Brassica cretica TaxID=69181 RepID=A0A8S9III0_BRACR|nr:hypothetical protein F2Q68_00025597 [Brassica cretica]